MLVSSHLLSDIERICHQVVIFQEGHLRLQGTLNELIESHQATVIVNVKTGGSILMEFLTNEHQIKSRLIQPNSLEVFSEDDSIYDLLFQSAYALGLQIRQIQKRERKLEEMFLDLFNSNSESQRGSVRHVGRESA